MKRINLLMYLFIVSSLFAINVNAASSPAYCEHDLSQSCSNPTSDYTSKKSSFESGLKKYNITSSDTITLYGKSECNGTSCSLSYADRITDFEEAIAKSVTCTNGEKYVTYQNAGGGKSDYNTTNTAKLTGTAYWDEDYLITCTTNSTGTSTISIDETTNSNNTNTNTGNTSTNNGYDSSTTVDSENTGVSTYFVVLGLVAIISYSFMLSVKKFNLFKKI